MLSASEYRTLVEQAAILIWRANRTGGCDYFNDRWLAFRGRTLEQEVGSGWAEGVHPGDLDRCLRIYMDAFHARQIFEMEYRLRRFDGVYRWIHDRGVPLFHPDGSFNGFVGSCSDVTDRVQAEKRARRAQKLKVEKAKADEASRQKSAFLANMSHEIRTPMTGVLGMLRLLASTPLNTEQAEYVGAIRYSAEALLRLINDILDFSKMEAGKLDLVLQEFTLRDEVENIAAVMRILAGEKQVRLETSVAPELLPMILGDLGRLRQILMNLMGNAVKFTPAGGDVRLSVFVEAGTRLRFEVSDTGIGISQDALARLFNPFEQADPSTARLYGGTGLGLSISKRLVEMMGGDSGAISQPGTGSTFWFWVPLLAAHPAMAPHEFASLPAGSDAGPAVRLLVAEDNVINQKVIVRMLTRMGYAPTIVSTGREAVEAFRSQEFGAVLMDCFMPEMDGFEAAGRIRALETPTGTRTPIIALTASVMEADRDHCLRAGMDDFVGKPVDVETLAAALQRWTGNGPLAAAAGGAD